MLPSAPATPASAVCAPTGPIMMSPTAGGRAGVACPHDCTLSLRPPEATTGGSRARDALDGHEESAGFLINDRARVVVGDVPQKSLWRFGSPGRRHLLHQ